MIASDDALVIDKQRVLGEAGLLGIRQRIDRPAPTGSDGIGPGDLSRNPRVRAVSPIEMNAAPIDEWRSFSGRLARPSPGNPHRVVIVNDPMAAAGNAARARIEPHGDPLVGDVGPSTVGDPGELVGAHQTGTIVHHHPRLDIARLGAARISPRQTRQIIGIERSVLRQIPSLQVGLADVVNDIVLLPRHHPTLSGHQTETASQRLIHGERIVAVAELALGESQRRRQGARRFERAVAVRADPRIDLFATPQRVAIQGSQQPGMVQPRLVVGQGRGEQRGRRLQLASAGRSSRADFEHVTHQIQKLLPPRQLIHLPGGHQRSGLRTDFLDFASRQRHRFAKPGRVPKHKPFGRAFDDHPGKRFAAVEHHSGGLETLANLA